MRHRYASMGVKLPTRLSRTVADRNNQEGSVGLLCRTALERVMKRFANVWALLVNIERSFERVAPNQICLARND